MIVVEERVFDAGSGERRGEVRLPYALGKPRTARAGAENFSR